MTNVVIYCRYSSTKQDSGFSIEAQLNACREYCKTNELIIIKEYIDEAKSGRSSDRPQFNQMLEDAKTETFSQIIINKFDRFSRNRTDSVIIKAKLQKHNIAVKSVTEFIDNSNAYGVVMESLYESLSHAYSQNLARESLKGMIQAVKNGFHVTGKAPFGYDLSKVTFKNKKRSKLIINKNEAEIVKKIYDMYINKKLGYKSIAIQLNKENIRTRDNNLFTSTYISKVMQLETYTGTVNYNKDRKFGFEHVQIKNNHPAIISVDQFNQAQKIIQYKQKTKVKLHSNFILSGVLRCECGSKMSGITGTSKNKVRHQYYSCIQKLKNNSCKRRNVRRDHLDECLINAFRNEIVNKKTIKTITKDTVVAITNKKTNIKDQINNLQIEYQKTKNKYNKLINIIESNNEIDICDLAPRIKEHKNKMDKIKIQIQNKNIENKNIESFKIDKDQIQNEVIKIIDSIEFNKKHLLDHIKKVELCGNTLKIEWCLLNEKTGSPVLIFQEQKSYYFQTRIA